MEGERLEVLEKDAALAVHESLRKTGGSRGVQHPERMLEGQLGELERCRLGSELRPRHPLFWSGGRHVRGEVGEHPRCLEAWQRVFDLCRLLRAVEVASTVAVTVDDEEDL